jgi:hypothetical protein
MAAEAFVLLGLFRAALAVVPVHKIMKTVARERLGVVGDAALTDAAPGEASERDVAIAMRVRWAIEAVGRHSPVGFVCFPQTLAAYVMLRRRGVASTMVYGVARSPQGELIAHTWLLVGDRSVVGGEGSAGFAEVERWS